MYGPGTTSGTGAMRDTEGNANREADSTQTCPMNNNKTVYFKDYAYEVLFLQGDKSDVTIHALEREWHLHKNLLCRSGYFSAMFSGAWDEADKSEIEMAVPEDTTPEALHTAFGSLYKDDIEVQSETVFHVLNVALFLQIDILIDSCIHVIKKSISVSTVCTYYSVAEDLGLHELAEACLSFLECAFVTDQDLRIFFRSASIGLMEKVLRRGLLMALDETDLFLKVIEFATIESLPARPAATDMSVRLLEHMRTLDTPFICSVEGKPYRNLFQMLKLEQLVKRKSTSSGLKELLEAVFPLEDLHWAGDREFNHKINMINGVASVPDRRNISEETFAEECVRCTVPVALWSIGYGGTKLDLSCDTFLGYNFGMELQLHLKRRGGNHFDFYISPSKILRNWTVLCRLQVVVLRENTAPIRRCGSIVEVFEGMDMAQGAVMVPQHMNPGGMTDRELVQCQLRVAVQALFVNPVDS